MNDIMEYIAIAILGYALYRLGYHRGYQRGFADGTTLGASTEAVRNFWRNFKEACGQAGNDDTEAGS